MKNFFSKENWHFPFIAGLIFLCHPINSEAVLFIADLQEPLYTFFGLSALFLFSKSQTKLSAAVVGLLLLFALLSKESGLLYILAMLVHGFLFHKKHITQLIFSISVAASVYFLC